MTSHPSSAKRMEGREGDDVESKGNAGFDASLDSILAASDAGAGGAGLSERRRVHPPLDINIRSISSHAPSGRTGSTSSKIDS
jgi:hypothetical protein